MSAWPASEPCVVCGATALRPHLSVAGDTGPQGLIPTTDRFGSALSDIVRCSRCGHMQLEHFPAEARLEEAYADAASEAYIEEEAGQRETARRLLERIEAHVTPGDLLDLGCWTGFLLAEARERGWRPLGVEPSDFAADYACSQLGLEVIHGPLAEVELDRGRFAAVVMADVVEHLPYPGDALERAATALRPDGVLCLVLPDAGSRLARMMGRRWWSVIPTHVQYFTRGSLSTLLRRHGYTLLEVRTAPKVFTVRYYLGRLGGYSPTVRTVIVGAARFAGVAERMWAPDFRDRMLVIARPHPDAARRAASTGAAQRS